MKNDTISLWGEKRYHSLDFYLKNTYHEKVYRIALNAGLSCPNRDGRLDTRGCIFCSAGGSGDFAASPTLSITEQLETEKRILRAKRNCNKFIAYFQAFTNTYGSVEHLRDLYMQAVNDPDVVIISIATRPDCLQPEILSLLAEINEKKTVWVELGLQTIHDDTRVFTRSGFTYETFQKSLFALHALSIKGDCSSDFRTAPRNKRNDVCFRSGNCKSPGLGNQATAASCIIRHRFSRLL